MSSAALYPIRLTEEEILSNPAYTSYVVLNIPTHGKHVPFDTIGRTTFKKYIVKSYTDFYDNRTLKTTDFKSVPFVISKTPTIARVVLVSSKRQAPEINTNTTSKKSKQHNPNLIKVQPQKSSPQKPIATVQAQQLQSTHNQVQNQPQTQVHNLLEPALTLEMTNDTATDYYAPSHCKCSFIL